MSGLSSGVSGAATGAAIGAGFGGIGAVPGAIIGGAIGLAPSVFKFFSGLGQKKKANAMHPMNPGYQMNNQVIDNARILGDRYANYQLPGQSFAQGNINNTFQNAFTQGVQGASSGGDVLDLAAKLAYGKSNQEQQLAAQGAVGKEAALGQYLDANAAAGNEYQGKNTYDRSIYQQQMQQKADLTADANKNMYSALDNGASVISSYFNPKQSVTDWGNINSGNGSGLGSIFGNTQGATPQIMGQYGTPNGGLDYSKIYMNNRYK